MGIAIALKHGVVKFKIDSLRIIFFTKVKSTMAFNQVNAIYVSKCYKIYFKSAYANNVILAGTDFIPGRYNATFSTGDTTATATIPIIAGGNDNYAKNFSLRLFIDGDVYQQCVFPGNVSTATVTVMPGIYHINSAYVHAY